MKLHLPNSLRRALLACLASLPLSAALPSGLGTASGTAALFLLAQQGKADFTGPTGVQWPEPEQWSQDMTISGSMVVDMTTDVNRDNLVFRTSRGDTNLKLTWTGAVGDIDGDQVSAADKVEFTFGEVGAFNNLWLDGHGRYFITSDTTSFSNQIRDIYISGAQLLVDSTASEITDWTANIHVGSSSAAEGAGAFAVFKNFTTRGALDVVEEATITFGWSSEAANMTFDRIEGEAKLEISGESNGTLTLTNGGRVVRGINSRNAGVTVAFGGTLVWEGGAQITGTLKALDGASLELSGSLNVGCISGTLTNLVWNTGGSIVINYDFRSGPNPEFVGSLSVETLTLNAQEDTYPALMIDVTGGGTISIKNLTGDGVLILGLYGVTDEMIGTEGYTLFPTWEPKWAEHILLPEGSYTDSERPLKLDPATGKITAEAPPDVEWDAPANGTLTWESGGSEGWKDGGTFTNSANVTMTAQGGAGDRTVTTDIVLVKNFTITGEGSTFNFIPPPEATSVVRGGISVSGLFTIGNGCKVFLASKMQLTLNEGENTGIELGDGAELYVTDVNDGHDTANHNGWSNQHTAESPLVIRRTGDSGTGTLTIDMSGDRIYSNDYTASTTFDGSAIEFGEGIKLHIIGNADNGTQYVKDLGNLSELELTGEGIVIRGTNNVGTLTVTSATKLTLGESASLTVQNVNLQQGGTLKWSEANSAVTVNGTQFNGGTLQLDGGRYTAGNWTNGTLTGLVLAEGTTLDLGSSDATLNFGAITLNGNATLNLGGGSYESLMLSTSGITSTVEEAKLTITLSKAFLQSVATGSGIYKLFSDTGWSADYVQFTTPDGNMGSYEVEWGENGNITVVDTSTPYEWNTDGPDNIWGTGHTNWAEGGDWKEGANATFSGAGEEITVQGNVNPRRVVVTSGQWTFTGDGSITAKTSDADGLTLSGTGTSVKFTGSGKKSFGGKADAPGIHLGAGTELIIGQDGEEYGDTHWMTGGVNYAEGAGSIVLDGVTVTNNGSNNGLLFAFFAAGDNVEGKSIGALKLRASATLTMNGEMGAETTGHSLGYFKEIYVEDGSTLNDASGALGKKIHTGNVLHLAGRGTSGNGALIISHARTEDWQQVDWNITADADALISVEKSKTFNGSLGAQGHTLSLKTAAGQTTTLAGAFTTGGQSGTLDFTGGGNVTLGTGFSATGGGTLRLSEGTRVTSYANNLSGVTLNLNGGTFVGAQNGAVSLGGISGDNGGIQVQFSEGVQLKITGEGEGAVSGFISLMITGVEDTNTFLDTLKGDGYQLFKTNDGGHWESAWADIFDASVEGLDPESGFIIIDEKGTLRWTEEVGDELSWGSGAGETELTWGTGTTGDKLTPAGGGEPKAWKNGTAVRFAGDLSTGRTVKLAGNISTGSFNAAGKFNFRSTAPDEKHDLRIGGKELTAEGAELTFEDTVNLTVGSEVITLTDSTLSVAGTATFSGNVLGNGTIAATNGANITITGGISEFTGTLNTGTGSITLKENATAGNVNVTANGNGTLAIESSETGTHFTGAVGMREDTLTLTNTGTGMLYVTAGASSSAGAKLNGGTNGQGITLGDSSGAATWAGSEVTGGTVTLANVTLLANGGLRVSGDGAINVNTSPASPAAIIAALRDSSVASPPGGVVDVNGTDAVNLANITINNGGQLKNVTGTYTADANHKLTLYFSVDNLGTTEVPSEGKYAPIVGKDGGNFTLDARNKSSVIFDISAVVADIFTVLSETKSDTSPGVAYLYLLQGGTLLLNDISATDLVGYDLLSALASNFNALIEGTDIELTGDVGDVFVVPEKMERSVDAAMLNNMKATVVGTGRSITFTADGEAKLPNVLGGRGSSISLQRSENASAGRVTFTFDNSLADVAAVDPPYPEFDGTTVAGQDTVFLGRISTGAEVDVAKTGMGTLTVGDNFTMEDAKSRTQIKEGSLRLLGTNNLIPNLVFAYASDTDKERGLLLENGQTEISSISDVASKTATVSIRNNAELILTGASSLSNTSITGDGSGILRLKENAHLAFTGDKGTANLNVEMKNAVLDFGATESTLASLKGSGSLMSASGGELTVSSGTFTGTLEKSGTGDAGLLAVADGATFTLDKVTSSAKTGVRLGNNSTLNVNVNVGDAALAFGNVDLGDGSLKLDYGDKALGSTLVTGNITGWGDAEAKEGKGKIEFHSNGPVTNGTLGTGFRADKTLADGKTKDELSAALEQHFKFTGLGNFLKDHSLSRNTKTGEVELTTTDAENNKFERAIPGAGKNAHAGASMLWDSLRSIRPEEAFTEMFKNPNSDYAGLINSLVQCIDNQSTGSVARTLAAAAGSSISTLGPALAQDVHRQLSAIRNRTSTMIAEPLANGYEELPLWHAWLNAEGAYHELDADGLAPGFTLHNWGGTVGIDVNTSRMTTVGLAITAMYGDLKPDSADSASGDLDTYYLSAFARVTHGAWLHTFVLSGGIADVTLTRTVNCSGAGYRTNGSTDGSALGAMYEVGYTGFVNKRRTMTLQPIANAELRYVSLHGYSESGSDAGVNTGDIEQTVLTLGIGARVRAAVSENAFNRSTILEGRLLLKSDLGDRSGTAENAVINHASRAEVESAEVGAIGIETGIGISIPIDAQSGTIFADASLEWRDNWISTNASIGYRVSF